MEAQLQGLIDKIKTEGVAEAEKQAKKVVAEAEERAKKIVAEAKSQAEQITNQAKNEAVRTEEAGKKALEQASRNLFLGLQKNITDLFNRLLQKEIGKALSPEAMAGMLQKIVANWDRSGAQKDLEVLLGKKEAEDLSKGLLKKIQEEAKSGITLKPVESVDVGFRIGEKGGSMHYDFTDKGLAEILAQYLNPKLAEILKN
jgi:V/A-type H+-transporting ATPase subunit E